MVLAPPSSGLADLESQISTTLLSISQGVSERPLRFLKYPLVDKRARCRRTRRHESLRGERSPGEPGLGYCFTASQVLSGLNFVMD